MPAIQAALWVRPFWRCRRDENHLPVFIGRPINNTQIYILDSDMEPVPVGVAGELYIGGVGLARGYLHEPGLTAEKFLPHRYSQVPGERLYRTGDLGRYHEDGNIEYLGRADYQVKIRGFRIELGEVEVVLRAYPAVHDAAVLVHEQQLVAYIAGDRADRDALRQYLKECLPEYMLPARFVWLENIPLLPNGKVDRKALPAPEAGITVSRRVYVTPRNAIELDLAAIWSWRARNSRESESGPGSYSRPPLSPRWLLLPSACKIVTHRSVSSVQSKEKWL